MKKHWVTYFSFCWCVINLLYTAENNQNNDLTLDKLSTRIDKASNKIDNEFCAIWEVFNEFKSQIEAQKREIAAQKRENSKQNIQIVELSKRLAVLEVHTHGYFLSNTYGGLGNKTQTTRPLQVKTEIPRGKPYQIQADQTSTPVVKPQ